MDLQPNKQDAIVLPITNTRISASEWNQLVGSCMAFITAAGLTPDASDNEQFLNAFKIVAANLELIGANTNLSNLTATGEAKFDAKADINLNNVSANIDYIVDRQEPTAANNYSWYDLYKSGKLVQGGFSNTSGTITLLQPYKDANYHITTGFIATAANYYSVGVHINPTPTTTSFSASMWNNSSSGGAHGGFWWRTEGFKGE